MRLSKSALYTYVKCPHAYYLQYVLGYSSQATVEMEEGRKFHEEAYDIFDDISLKELADQTSIFGIERYIRSFFSEGLVYDRFSHILTTHYISLNNKKDFMPVEREIKLEVTDAPDYCLDVGVIDRIDRVDGRTTLIEYKSGSFRQGINQELMMYKVLVETATQYKIDDICAIYPHELYGTKLPSGVYFKQPSHEKEAKAKVAYVKQQIRKKNWNNKRINACAWCTMADACFSEEEMIE